MDDAQNDDGPEISPERLKELLPSAGFAFRGFDQTNLGKTPELLAHQIYGPIVEKHLLGASEVASDVLGRGVDLVTRVRERQPETLADYAESISMIVAVEMAQLELLHEFFGIEYRSAPLALGYSLGEVAALVASGVYSIDAVLTPLLALSDDMVAQAEDVRMGIVFSRGPVMEFSDVERLCLEITNQGHGTIAISSYLSPNTVLVLGQRGTLDELKAAVKGRLAKGTNVKENKDRWPPIHTHITRQKHIPDRAAVMMERMPGGFVAPRPNILSCVTGTLGYTDINSRDLLNRWVDEPQRLWDVVEQTIASGIELLIHVGPGPNIIPATLQRISQNVQQQLAAKTWAGLGRRAVSRMVRRPWLTKLLSSKANLLRAPFIQEVILEDWLLTRMP